MIDIKYDEACEMMVISDGDVIIFEGNYWDFDYSPAGLSSFLDICGVPVCLEKYEYEC